MISVRNFLIQATIAEEMYKEERKRLLAQGYTEVFPGDFVLLEDDGSEPQPHGYVDQDR